MLSKIYKIELKYKIIRILQYFNQNFSFVEFYTKIIIVWYK